MAAETPQESLYYNTFARQLYDDIHLPSSVFMLLLVCVLEDSSKLRPNHMEVLPGHYKGPYVTSKGHIPLLIPVATIGKCKQAKQPSQ